MKRIIVFSENRQEYIDYVESRTLTKLDRLSVNEVTFYSHDGEHRFIYYHPNSNPEMLRGYAIDEVVMLTPVKNEMLTQIIYPCMIAARVNRSRSCQCKCCRCK